MLLLLSCTWYVPYGTTITSKPRVGTYSSRKVLSHSLRTSDVLPCKYMYRSTTGNRNALAEITVTCHKTELQAWKNILWLQESIRTVRELQTFIYITSYYRSLSVIYILFVLPHIKPISQTRAQKGRRKSRENRTTTVQPVVYRKQKHNKKNEEKPKERKKSLRERTANSNTVVTLRKG